MTKISMDVGNPQENVRQKPHTAGVGNERTADMSVVGDSSLSGGVSALRSDHANGVPHQALHGLRPSK